MSNSIEPPVLLSRLMTFVFSATLVVVVVLIITLVKMFPLNKTQIFFLTTQPRSDLEIRLSPFSPNAENLEAYKHAFIKEYIKARNEIVPSAVAMIKKWDTNGTVNMWSTPDVYKAFSQTEMWMFYMYNSPNIGYSCRIEFNTPAIAPRSENTYAVSFRYLCINSDGQTPEKDSTIILRKDYTIALRLELDQGTIKWTNRLDNPLGIRVAEYKIEHNDTDPLNFNF